MSSKDDLITQVVKLRDQQTEKERSKQRAAFEEKWPELAGYITQAIERCEDIDPELIAAMEGEPGGPTKMEVLWYMLDCVRLRPQHPYWDLVGGY
jgi:hypothetical protein